MSICIFAGPTLPPRDAARAFDATWLPPAKHGDVLRAVSLLRPRAIGIVDGYFQWAPSVWHKEILWAIRQGVHVFGAASMGALRAAELDSFGMVGVGAIYRWFAGGTLTDDDEVAVIHGPEELAYPRLSDAMVDIRDACADACGRGIVSADTASRLVTMAKALPFSERSYNNVAELARAEGMAADEVAAWQAFVATRGPGLKERDARELLQGLHGFLQHPPAPFEPRFTLERSEFLTRLVDEVALSCAGGLDRPRDGDGAPPLGTQPLEQLRRKVLLRILARSEAERQGWSLSGTEVDEQLRKLCSSHDIATVGALSAWMASSSVTDETLWRFVNDACFIDRLERLYCDELAGELPRQLRLSTMAGNGRIGDWP